MNELIINNMKEKKVIKFCQNSCCPVIEFKDDKVILGDKDGIEGITVWNKSQFKDFIKAVKDGKFEDIDDM